MALIQLLGSIQLPRLVTNTGALTFESTQLNATGEHLDFTGNVYLEGGTSGGTKTISSAGGKLWWRVGSSTFANAGTTFRIGLQDTSAASTPAQGDGTFDVYKDLVGGTDTIAANTAHGTAMDTGTKTLTHGDVVSCTFEMISRAGSDDVRPNAVDHPTNGGTNRFPAVVSFTPGGLRVNGTPNLIIEFDDGTYGWFFGSLYTTATGSNAFGVSTGTADEYGNLFQVDASIGVAGVTLDMNTSTATADFELILYSDPLGTPSIIEAVTVDATQISTTTLAGMEMRMFTESHTLVPGTTYAVTIRPTTTSNVTFYHTDIAEANQWKMHGLSGDDCYAIRRLDNTGAFSDYNGGTAKTRRMGISLMLDQVNEDSSGGGVAAHSGLQAIDGGISA